MVYQTELWAGWPMRALGGHEEFVEPPKPPSGLEIRPDAMHPSRFREMLPLTQVRPLELAVNTIVYAALGISGWCLIRNIRSVCSHG